LLVFNYPAHKVVLFKGQPDTNECLVESLDRFESVSAEKAKEVKAVREEGVVKFKSGLSTGELTDDSAVYLETTEHLADLRELASIEVWQGVGCELVEAFQG
jgi:hypothetical protein